jgi:UDP-2-acetamido-3-amino-2,3-dideoxy-glucuronate N-acetyltransferase
MIIETIENARVGLGTKVYQPCTISQGAKVGDDCLISQFVFIEGNVKIGNRVKIKNNVSVYDAVTIEDDVFIGPSVVFTNVTTPRSFWPRKDEYKRTIIKQGASIGANSTIVCGHVVGEYALVGAGSVVTHNIPAYALVYGNPARQHGWVCYCGCILNEKLECDNCNRIYITDIDGSLQELKKIN